MSTAVPDPLMLFWDLLSTTGVEWAAPAAPVLGALAVLQTLRTLAR